MSEFVKTLQGFVAHMPEGQEKHDVQEALQVCPDIDFEVVPEERANKEMRKLRDGALKYGHAYLIARGGRVDNLEEAALVISTKTIARMLGSVHDGTERKAARRRPASAVLAQLKPMDPSVADMRLKRRTHDEVLGGRGKLS